MRKTILAVSLCFATLLSHAQNEVDAFDFTGLEYGGTARFIAMGSSMGALGGDLSVLSTNPAGLGLFRKGEFTLSPTFVASNSSSLYRGERNDEDDLDFTINNIGYAQVYKNETGPWKMVQFAVTLNRLKDFHTDYRIEGTQAENSLLDFVTSEATSNNLLPDDLESSQPFLTYPAYQTFLINPYSINGNTVYFDTLPDGIDLIQSADIQNRGRISETSIAGAGNYEDKLYVGASLGFVRIIKEEQLSYRETVVDTSQATLEYYQFDQNLEVSGNGFNFRIGAILRATDALRIGGSYTTPTWYAMSNEWTTNVASKFKDGSGYSTGSPVLGLNEYDLRTPSRLLGSLGLVIGKQGMFNIEYEYLDFGKAKFSAGDLNQINFAPANNEIRRQYTNVGNVRVGGEYRYNAFSLRGGGGYYPSPYNSGLTESDAEKMIYSGGLGYQKDRIKIDLGYRKISYSSDYYIYNPSETQAALINQDSEQFVLTFGLRF